MSQLEPENELEIVCMIVSVLMAMVVLLVVVPLIVQTNENDKRIIEAVMAYGTTDH